MGPVLKGLIKLQSVENLLRAEKAKLTRCRRNVIIQENKIRSLQNALEAKKEEVQLSRVQLDRLELELKSRDETIARLRASLNSAKTNKEYAAVLTQLNTTKADNSKIETQSLELLKVIETDESECQEIQKEIDEQKKVLEETRKESEKLAKQYEGKKGPYSCGGCFMGITAESVNLLMTKDDIIRCPNCTRILVLGDAHKD
jgi:predicted  nucleic acid-binding Zn-ribbon protein